MASKKQKVSDLRVLNKTGSTMLLEMVEAGKFEELVSIVKADKEANLTLEDALKPNTLGVNLVMLLGWQNKLEKLFSVTLWKKNYKEAQELMAFVPDQFMDQINQNKLSAQLTQQALQQQQAVRLRKRRPNR